MLKSVYLAFRKVKVQMVTVVEFGMYGRSGDGVGCLGSHGRGECSTADECDSSRTYRVMISDQRR